MTAEFISHTVGEDCVDPQRVWHQPEKGLDIYS